MLGRRSGRLLELQVLLVAHALSLALLFPRLPRDAPWIVAIAGATGLLVAHVFVRVHYPDSGRTYLLASLLLSGLSVGLYYWAPIALVPVALVHPYLGFRVHEWWRSRAA